MPQFLKNSKEECVLALAAATPEELCGILGSVSVLGREALGGTCFFSCSFRGSKLRIVQTGIGTKKAGAAAEKLLRAGAPRKIILMGAAGAADPLLNIGDAVLVGSTLHYASGRYGSDALVTDEIGGRLAAAGFPAFRGDCFTARGFIHGERKKLDLFRATGARVIDMESAGFMEPLRRAGRSCVNIRIVSDTARADAFDVEAYYRCKRRGGMGAAAYFLKNPGEIVRAAALKKSIGLVAEKMARILDILVE